MVLSPSSLESFFCLSDLPDPTPSQLVSSVAKILFKLYVPETAIVGLATTKQHTAFWQNDYNIITNVLTSHLTTYYNHGEHTIA